MAWQYRCGNMAVFFLPGATSTSHIVENKTTKEEETMKQILTYTMKETIKSMLLAGKVGCDIAYEMGVSQSAVSKVRKQLMQEHPELEV